MAPWVEPLGIEPQGLRLIPRTGMAEGGSQLPQTPLTSTHTLWPMRPNTYKLINKNAIQFLKQKRLESPVVPGKPLTHTH